MVKLNIEKFKTDERLEKSGTPFVWMGYTFFVKRIGGTNSEFGLGLNDLISRIGDEDGEVDPDNKKYIKMLTELLVDKVLCGWSGIKEVDEDGKETNDYKYTRKRAIDLLMDYADLRDGIFKFAQNRANYLVQRNEAKAKNS